MAKEPTKTTKKAKDFKVTNYEWSTIGKHILRVQIDAKSLRDKIHSLAVSILKHWHDNPSDGPKAAEYLTSLATASPYHGKAFATWLQEMTPLAYSEETEVWYVTADSKRINGKQFIAARDKPFWVVSPAPKAKPMDIFEEIERLIAKVERHQKKPVEGDVIDMAAVNALRSLRQAQEDSKDVA